MKYISLILIQVFLGLQFNYCNSTNTTQLVDSSKSSVNFEALVNQLNKQLDDIEIEGFMPNKTDISDKLYKEWEKRGIPILKEILPKVPPGYTLKITGHADPYGGLEAANKVAGGRAKNIHEKVTKVLGIDGSKIGIKNYGAEDYEQEKNLSVSKNRRVEFQIYKN